MRLPRRSAPRNDSKYEQQGIVTSQKLGVFVAPRYFGNTVASIHKTFWSKATVLPEAESRVTSNQGILELFEKLQGITRSY